MTAEQGGQNGSGRLSKEVRMAVGGSERNAGGVAFGCNDDYGDGSVGGPEA